MTRLFAKMPAMRLILLVILSLTIAGGSEAVRRGTNRAPVLVELFTSEGCSSCPPADRLLETLDREQPIPAADVIVLSEHVDYWNHLGWADPFSSPVFSRRQERYASQEKADVYTPEMVVDGHAKFVGSDRSEAERAITLAARQPKASLSISAHRDGDNEIVRVEALGTNVTDTNADLYIVLANDRARSSVDRGENAGRALTHVSVAYSFTKAQSGREVRIPAKQGKTRIIAFLQDKNTLQIRGSAQTLN
jgi:hypothetical protein